MRLQLRRTAAGVLVFGAAGWLGCGGSNGTASILSPDVEAGADGATDAQSSDGSGGPASTDGEGGTGLGDGGGPGGDTTMIPCGGAACNIPAQVCCINTGGGGGGANVKYTCTSGSCGKIVPDGGDAAAASGNGDVTALGCTGIANCGAGSICCIHQPSNGGVISECTAGKTCGNNAAQMCDPNAAAPGCPATGMNAVCSSSKIDSWGLTPPFATCGGIGN